MIRIIATAGAAQLMLMGSVHGAAEPEAAPSEEPRGWSEAKTTFVNSVVKATEVGNDNLAYSWLGQSLERYIMGDMQVLDYLPGKYKNKIENHENLRDIAGAMVDYFVDDFQSWTAEKFAGKEFVQSKWTFEIPKDFEKPVLKKADDLIQTCYTLAGLAKEVSPIKSFEELSRKFKGTKFAEIKIEWRQNRDGAVPPRRRPNPRQRKSAPVPPPKPEPKKEEHELSEESKELKMLYRCYDFLCQDKEAKYDDKMGAQRALYKIEEQERFEADPDKYGPEIQMAVDYAICSDQRHKDRYAWNDNQAAAKVYKHIMEAFNIQE